MVQRLSKLVFFAMFLAALLPARFATAAEGIPGKETQPPADTVATCQKCHGPGGDSVSETVPRLNGQRAEYIIQRLNNFFDPTREDPHATKFMWPMVSRTSDYFFASLAEYYSRQKPTMNSDGKGMLASEGRKLYMSGASAQQLPACNACHGTQAEGIGAAPRLAGQHAVYLTNQLERFSFALRESDVMHPNLYKINEEQIKALVAYLAAK